MVVTDAFKLNPVVEPRGSDKQNFLCSYFTFEWDFHALAADCLLKFTADRLGCRRLLLLHG